MFLILTIGWTVFLLVPVIVGVCSYEILNWMGIPNDEDTKRLLYDFPIEQIPQIRPAIVSTSAFVMVSMLRVIATTMNLGYLGAGLVWASILLLYHYRNRGYLKHLAGEYNIYSACLLFTAYATWSPSYSTYNSLLYLFTELSLLLIVLTIRMIYLQTAYVSNVYVNEIPTIYHILWDNLTVFNYYRKIAYILGLYINTLRNRPHQA